MRESFFGNADVPKVVQFTEELELYIDWYKESDYQNVIQLMIDASKEGKGVGTKEFPNEESIRLKIQDPNEKMFVCKDNKNMKLVSAFFLSPCPLSRSQHSPNMGAYGFVDKVYRGQGIGQNLIYLMKYMASSLGYRSVISRHALISRTNIPGRSAGATYMGIIPKSLRIDKLNVVVDDVIVYYGYHWPQVAPEKVYICVSISVGQECFEFLCGQLKSCSQQQRDECFHTYFALNFISSSIYRISSGVLRRSFQG